MPTITRSIEIKARPATVWSLLASQGGMRQWLNANLEIDLQVGGRYRHISPGPDGTEQLITGHVLEMIPEKRLILSWFEDGPDTDWVYPIRLSFTLEAIPGGTRVTMVFDGFPGIGKASWPKTYEAYQRGVEEHDLLGHLCEAVVRHGA